MSEKKYDWAYFWELFFAYPRVSAILLALYSVSVFYISFFLDGLTIFNSLLSLIGALILFIPIKAYFTGAIRDVFFKKNISPFTYLMFMFWRGLIFVFLASPFLFPPLTQKSEKNPPKLVDIEPVRNYAILFPNNFEDFQEIVLGDFNETFASDLPNDAFLEVTIEEEGGVLRFIFTPVEQPSLGGGYIYLIDKETKEILEKYGTE